VHGEIFGAFQIGSRHTALSDAARSLSAYATHQNSADVIRLLKADGWDEVAVRGSHRQFKHPTKPGRVTVPHPKKDLPPGTLHSILKQAGLR